MYCSKALKSTQRKLVKRMFVFAFVILFINKIQYAARVLAWNGGNVSCSTYNSEYNSEYNSTNRNTNTIPNTIYSRVFRVATYAAEYLIFTQRNGVFVLAKWNISSLCFQHSFFLLNAMYKKILFLLFIIPVGSILRGIL